MIDAGRSTGIAPASQRWSRRAAGTDCSYRRCSRLLLVVALWAPTMATAATLHLYGPGGPAPAMKATASAFETLHPDVKVVVTAGPTPKWIDAARGDADLIYSGSEAMMSDFVSQLHGVLLAGTVEPLYLRPAAILVRPGNPRHITGFRDLLKPGVEVMVVHGAGQVGLWEDVAGRDGDITTIRAFRRNIVEFAPNSAAALERWQSDPKINAWLIYNIWSIAHPGLAQVVPLEAKYRIYRDCGIAFTAHGLRDPDAHAFLQFLKSRSGRAIFEKFGWSAVP